MNLLTLKSLFFVLLLACGAHRLAAQQLSVQLGSGEIGLDELYTITIVAEGEVIKDYSKFPDIEGLRKAGRSSSTSSVSVAGGQTVVGQRLTQNYQPTRMGFIRIHPFSIRVNGKSVDSKGATIKVGPALAPPDSVAQETAGQQPEEIRNLPEKQEYASGGNNAFLSLATSKKSVYVGEGVHVALYFYLAFTERHLLEFHNFSAQLPELIKKIKQPNVWEEYISLTEIEPEPLELEGKLFLRFKLHEGIYFPLTSEPLLFPSLGLQMIRYQISRTPSAASPPRTEELKTYHSAPRIVEVKELPPHPLRDKVAVGTYRLKESTDQRGIKTGKSFRYKFQIEGEGNLATLPPPQIIWPSGLEAYPPTIRQQTQRSSGRITGSKTFDFFVMPKEPGNYNFNLFASWVFFNTATSRYDTLRAGQIITVTGPSNRNSAIAAADLGGFYEIIETADNDLLSMEDFERIKFYANIVVALLLLVALYIYVKK